MIMLADQKYTTLIESLKELEDIAIAFSGGVDSAFLLRSAREALGDKVLAITVNTEYIPEREIKEARGIAAGIGVTHDIINLPVPEQILHNPGDRCYLCKTFLFTMLKDHARRKGYIHVAEGSNADDTGEYRPGMKALKELGILSPLLEANLHKKDIRTLSRDMGMETWNKPAYACLLTRMPYDTRIRSEDLRRIERSEAYLIDLGIRAVRVRSHGNLARIETEPLYMGKIFREDLAGKIAKQLTRYGFTQVTLDLAGYRTGGIEEILKNKSNDRKG
jgi:uncharacterized protein